VNHCKARWRTDFNLRRLMNMLILKSRGVVIVSYPRSGRTWLLAMLHALSIDPRFSHGGVKNTHLDSPDTVCQDIPDYLENRILLILRDPRDSIVSHHQHYLRKKKWEGDLPSFMRDPIWGFERLLAFNLGWLQAGNRFKDFTTVRYEDLRRNTEIELKRIVSFLGCKISGPQALSKVVAEHAFEQMKQRERSGELHARYGKLYSPFGSENDNEMVVRRGVIGSHVEEMTAADREFCEEMLKRYNYHVIVDQLAGRGNVLAA